MTLTEFGALLRSEREKRNLSLEDVANKLKIAARTLKILEEGDTANFPHVAYAKGFMRSYGSYLGLSVEEINPVLAQLAGELNIEVQNTHDTVVPMSSGLGRLIPQLLVLALFLGIVGGVGYLIWQRGFVGQVIEWVSSKTESFKQKPNTDLKDKNHLSTVKEHVAEPQTQVAPKEQPKENDPLEALKRVDTTAGPRASLLEESQAQNTTNPQLDASKPQTAAPEETAQNSNEFQQVIVVAIEPCWIHSSADKTEIRQFSLRKGDTFSLQFRKELELKLGNAGGVRFRYNGQDVQPLGKSGQVKTVVFPLGEEQ